MVLGRYDMAAMRIFTIGYESATQAEVLATLSAARVEPLADVRAVPLSRRPGFSKNVLAAGLRDAGIDYVGLKALGTPPEGREAARKGDHGRLAAVYAGQLELPGALAQLAQLRALAADRPTALLCFEREPGGYHRSLLVRVSEPYALALDDTISLSFLPEKNQIGRVEEQGNEFDMAVVMYTVALSEACTSHQAQVVQKYHYRLSANNYRCVS